MSLIDRFRDYAWMTRQFLTAPLGKLPGLEAARLPGQDPGEMAGAETGPRGRQHDRGEDRGQDRQLEAEQDRASEPEQAAALPRIVFVPGIYEANEYVRPLARAFNGAGYPVSSGYLGKRTRGPVADLAAELLRRIEGLGPVIILGHSKGGLIGRAALASSDEVLGLITIATPWRGSVLAWPFPRRTALGRLAPGGADSALGWSQEREMGIRERIWSIRPASDPHIPFAADLDGAHNVVVPAVGHFRPLGHPATIRAALDAAAELLANRRA